MAGSEYSGQQNASVRTCGKQRSGGRKAPLEQLNCNAYPVGFPVKALPRQRCLQPLLERLQDIGFYIVLLVGQVIFIYKGLNATSGCEV